MPKQRHAVRATSSPVRVRMPARIAYDLDGMQKTLANLAEELGHPACLSGADCIFELNANWVVNPAGELIAEGIAVRG